jgi:hypothetical protein
MARVSQPETFHHSLHRAQDFFVALQRSRDSVSQILRMAHGSAGNGPTRQYARIEGIDRARKHAQLSRARRVPG